MNSVFGEEGCFGLFGEEGDDVRRDASTERHVVAVADFFSCSFGDDESFFELGLGDIPVDRAIVFYKDLFIDSSRIIASFDQALDEDSR